MKLTDEQIAVLEAEAAQEARERRMDEVEERFEREVDIVRGAGGFAPTTGDLVYLGEARAYASINQVELYDHEAELEEMRRLDVEEWKAMSGRRVPDAMGLILVIGLACIVWFWIGFGLGWWLG